ncbi:FAD-binding protein [Alteribacillus iranensis]|uniref:Dissimilatory adenylylsulfate reductase alpha subunit n=1 Tax=Alteribacillus iranensis TaxID=930128 RepID=A0A1I2EK10_9BACI|nr:FAD-binding protein [Alteribacillus iranensis]SFE93195.1 dissimilatory adenylylsulfate reductase alpha subunit precursor [Alteribacillus iranensis]
MRTYEFDILCIGSGVSGLMASIAASEEHKDICIVSKDPFSWGNTRISGGVIASNQDSSLDIDILNAGRRLNSSELVETLLNDSENIHETVESWGHIYRRNGNKKIKIKPGGHSEARTYISSYKGISLGNVLRMRLLEETNVKIIEETIVCKILTHDSRVYGAICYNWIKDTWYIIYAKQIILATGGGGMLYDPHTDNMRSSTGDSYSLALQCGASLIDMEQIQFIPFGVAYPQGMTGLEIGDTAAAGPYGKLITEDGKLILGNIPSLTREEVSRKIALAMSRGSTELKDNVKLDPTANINKQDGKEAWVNTNNSGSLEAVKYAYGVKSYKWEEPFSVIPTVHYIMGGVLVDQQGCTEVDGLLVAGEAAGGVHGSGRLGSMSLFEGLVFGRKVGKIAAEQIDKTKDNPFPIKESDLIINEYKKTISNGKGSNSPFLLKKKLAEVMWKDVGLIKTEKSLLRAMEQIKKIEKLSKELFVNWKKSEQRQLILNTIELKMMVTTSKAIIVSSLIRRESRGSHYRLDYPSENNSEDYNVKVDLKDGEVQAKKYDKSIS